MRYSESSKTIVSLLWLFIIGQFLSVQYLDPQLPSDVLLWIQQSPTSLYASITHGVFLSLIFLASLGLWFDKKWGRVFLFLSVVFCLIACIVSGPRVFFGWQYFFEDMTIITLGYLFGAHYLLTKCDIEAQKLRLAFVTYLAMTEIELSNITPKYIEYNILDIRNRLFPVLRQMDLPRGQPELKKWASKTLDELHDALSILIPLKKEEVEFISLIRESGEIKPQLITGDKRLIQAIQTHPAILWVIKKPKNEK